MLNKCWKKHLQAPEQEEGLIEQNSKELTRVQVGHLHFNASGEGKRSETDGHNTDIEAGQKQATLKAGNPPGYTMPAKEVEAQKYSGGCPGAYQALLEFN
jgi:hypothetical protein